MKFISSNILIISLFFLASCVDKVNNQEISSITQAEKIYTTDSSIITNSLEPASAISKVWDVCDSTLIGKENYYACSRSSDGKMVIISSINDTIVFPIEYGFPEFRDFNNDGYEDLFIHYNSNVPGIIDMALYFPKKQTFQLVENMSSFPNPNYIPNTDLIYSYHRSGCSDINWDSDLFYIEQNKAIKIGNIEGLGCEEELQVINVYKFNKTHGKQLISKYPIDTIESYKDYKWGFIKDYWINNYSTFK